MKTFISLFFFLTLFSGPEIESSATASFSGSWVSEDSQTRSITSCRIRYENDHYLVQMWGACRPQDCDWGENASGTAEEGTARFEVLWDQDFAESKVTYELEGDRLKMTNRRRYKDGSGRKDLTVVNYFVKD